MERYTISEASACSRSASLEDNGSDKLFENNSNMPLFFSAGPDNSSVKPEDDDAMNKRGQVGTTREEMRGNPSTFM